MEIGDRVRLRKEHEDYATGWSDIKANVVYTIKKLEPTAVRGAKYLVKFEEIDKGVFDYRLEVVPNVDYKKVALALWDTFNHTLAIDILLDRGIAKDAGIARRMLCDRLEHKFTVGDKVITWGGSQVEIVAIDGDNFWIKYEDSTCVTRNRKDIVGYA